NRVGASDSLRALRIRERDVGTVRAEEVSVIALPGDASFGVGPWSNDIRTAVRIQRIAGRALSHRAQIPRIAMRQIEDETGLPVFDRACQKSAAVLEEQFAGSDR